MAQPQVKPEVKTETPATTALTKEQIATNQKANLAKLVSKFGTKSAMIRGLTAEGMSRSDIAKSTGLRYQHVRNVLITPIKTPKVVAAPAPAATEKK